MFVCKKCGKRCKTSAGLSSHTRRCGTAPTRAELRGLIGNCYTQEQIAQRYGVHANTVKNWLQRYGIRQRAREGGLRVWPELAPLFGHHGSCACCEGFLRCSELVARDELALCEAPDEGDMARAARMGMERMGVTA
jgi:transposase-like protein